GLSLPGLGALALPSLKGLATLTLATPLRSCHDWPFCFIRTTAAGAEPALPICSMASGALSIRGAAVTKPPTPTPPSPTPAMVLPAKTAFHLILIWVFLSWGRCWSLLVGWSDRSDRLVSS